MTPPAGESRQLPLLAAAGRGRRPVRGDRSQHGKELAGLVDWAYQDWRRYGRVSAPLGLKRPGVLFVPIVGMHRSGTSCVTGILERNGLHLSGDLIDPNPFNPEGFWESREVIRINDLTLSRYGYPYMDPEGVVPSFPRPILRRAERYLSASGHPARCRLEGPGARR